MTILKKLVEVFKKYFNVDRMITEDKIAAAQLAQIFGSELALIDENVTHRSNNTSKAVKLDPKKILLDQEANSPSGSEVIKKLQQEAEAAFPFDLSQQLQQQQQSPPSHSSSPQWNNPPSAIAPAANSQQLDKLCDILERLVNIFEASDIIIRKQPQFRKDISDEING